MNELDFEVQALLPQLSALRVLGSSRSSFSTQLLELEHFVRRAYRADQCVAIFLPYGPWEGLIMHGPMHFREIGFVQLEGSLVQDLVSNPDCSSLTMPSNLLWPNPFRQVDQVEDLISVTG